VGSVVTYGSTANSGSRNITVPSGAKLAVIFWFTTRTSLGGSLWSMSSVSLGGVAGVIRSNVAVVFATTGAIGSATVENPPAGTQALAWDYTGSASFGSAFIVRFFTADGNIVVADWDAASGGQGSTVQSLTVDSASDGYVVGMAAGEVDVDGAPTGSGQTIDLDNFTTNNLVCDLSHVDSPGASTTTWNMTASQYASGAVVSLMEELAVGDIVQLQALDAPALTQTHVLAPGGLAQSQVFDTAGLTQTHILSVSDIAQ